MEKVGLVYHVRRCDCCGKNPLTVAVEFRTREGFRMYLGTTCARRFEGGETSPPVVRQKESARGQIPLF